MSWLEEKDPKTSYLAQSTIDYVASAIDNGWAILAYAFMTEKNPAVYITTALLREVRLIIGEHICAESLPNATGHNYWKVFRENKIIESFEARGEADRRISKLLLKIVGEEAEKSPNVYRCMYHRGNPYHAWKIFSSDKGFKKLNNLVSSLIKQSKNMKSPKL